MATHATTQVKGGVSVERAENGTVVRNHKGHDVTVGAGSVILKSDSGHVSVVDADVYDALFEEVRHESRDESPRWNDQAQ